MPLSDDQRFALLAQETNRQFAHAVIHGGLAHREASAFCVWVTRNDHTRREPAVNLAEYLDEDRRRR